MTTYGDDDDDDDDDDDNNKVHHQHRDGFNDDDDEDTMNTSIIKSSRKIMELVIRELQVWCFRVRWNQVFG